MSTVNEIRAKIAADADAAKASQPATGGMGNVVSNPGTEKVSLDATSFQLMECDGRVKGNEKRRYCYVEKGIKAQYSGQFVNAAGDRVHIITRELYMLLHSLFNGILKQLREMDSRARTAEEKAAMYKVTLDALKKNGVID